MSRFIKTLEEDKSTGYLKWIAYGFDHALGYWADIAEVNIDTQEENYLHEYSTTLGTITKNNLINLLITHNVNQKHIELMMLDLPF